MRNWKRHTRLVALFCVLLILVPGQASAGLGISFDLVSVGPFSLGIGIPLRGALPLLGILAAGAVVVSFFSGSGHRSYSTSYRGGESVTAVRQTISVSPDDHLRGRSLRMRLSEYPWFEGEWFEERRIPLPGAAYLEIQENGRMTFRECGFEGYVYWLYDGSFTVWDEAGKPVLILKPNWTAEGSDEPFTLLLLEQSTRSAQVLNLLFGREVS